DQQNGLFLGLRSWAPRRSCWAGSAQATNEILGTKMAVALKHTQLLVSAYGSHLDHVPTLLQEARDGFMPQIVKAKIIRTGSNTKMLPSLLNGALAGVEYLIAGCILLQPLKN